MWDVDVGRCPSEVERRFALQAQTAVEPVASSDPRSSVATQSPASSPVPMVERWGVAAWAEQLRMGQKVPALVMFASSADGPVPVSSGRLLATG